MKGDEKLVIRPLTKKEMAVWRSNFEEFGFETYAQLIPNPDKPSGKRNK